MASKTTTAQPPPKPKTLVIRVVRILYTRESQHNKLFEAVVSAATEKKRKKDKTGKFFGYLPSYSPGIEYTIVAVENLEKNESVFQIVKIAAWRRLCYWLTEQYVGDALEGHWPVLKTSDNHKDKRESDLFVEMLSTPACKEADLDRFKPFSGPNVRSPLPVVALFRNHFAPNVFFDAATLENLEDRDKNLFPPFLLEEKLEVFKVWQRQLDKDLLDAILINPPRLPNLKWTHIEQLITLANQRLKQGLLTEADKEYEESLKPIHQMERIHETTRRTQLEDLVYPAMPEHPYDPAPVTYPYIFNFAQTLRNKLKWSGDTSFTFHVPNTIVRDLIRERGILYEIGENQWTLPKHVASSTIVNRMLGPFYKKPEEVENPSTLDEAFSHKACMISTQGYNAFEVYRRLADKAEEKAISFVCPEEETAKWFYDEVGIMAYPMVPPKPLTKTLVFCFGEKFSFGKMADVMEPWLTRLESLQPEKILFFGDPDMVGGRGVGRPFVELMACGKLPVFNLSWQSPDSQNIYSQDIQRFLVSLSSVSTGRSLPWSGGVQLCDPERIADVHYEVRGNFMKQPLVNDYHILCDSFTELKKHEKALRTHRDALYSHLPPIGLHNGDKVWVEEKGCLDWVEEARPIADIGGGIGQPRSIAFPNKKNHLVKLHNGGRSCHNECCKLDDSVMGFQKPSVHTLVWCTAQTFRDNRVPVANHIMLIVAESTTKQHLYTAASMAKQRLTLVGTLQQVEKVLKKKKTTSERITSTLLDFTVNPENHVKRK